MDKSKQLLCSRCNKNKASMLYADNLLSFQHGFNEFICEECYNKQKKDNGWYKQGYAEAQKYLIESFEKIINETNIGVDALGKHKLRNKLKELKHEEILHR